MVIALRDLHSDYAGFEQLATIANALETVVFETITIDLSGVQWIDANMCSPLGALLWRAGRNLNAIALANVPGPVETILARNGFLANYGAAHLPDNYETTIPYRRFEPRDYRDFCTYVRSYLVGKGLPVMTSALLSKLQESVFEIFGNAATHAETLLGIYSCGQFYRSKHRLRFTLTDLGIGFRRNIESRLGLVLSGEQAIDWAMNLGNTSRVGPVPGGLGLKLLREFITKNGGRLQIASDTGYWELTEGRSERSQFPCAFPGSVVNIEFNTADTSSYYLSTEIRPEDIF